MDFNTNDANGIDNLAANYGKIDTLDVYQSSAAGYGVLTVGSSVGANGGTVQVYGSTNLQGGGGALSVLGGTTLDGNGYVHGVTMGTNKTAGILLTRIDVLPIGIDMFSATFITANATAALNTSSGGPTSIAAGSYINLESSTGQINIAGTGYGICDIVFENGGSVRQFGGLQGQSNGGAAVSNINSLTGYLTPAGNGMYILNVQNISGPATYGTISNMSSIELGYALPLYGPTGTYTGYTGFTGTREVTGSTGITDPSGQVIGYTGTTGIQYFQGQTGYTYQAQPVIGISGEASSLLTSPDGTGLYWNNNLIASGTGPVGAETWALYRAVGSVDVSLNNINNVQNLNGPAGIVITATQAAEVYGGQDVYVEATVGSANLTGQLDANINATTGIVNITGATSIDLLSTTNVGTSLTPKNLTVNGSANATSDVVSSYGGSNPYSLNTIGGLVNANQQYNYWVAVNGSNTTGTGSVLRPWATISYALASTASITDSIPISINITAGTYTENPTITRNNTFLVGAVGISNVVIVGTVTMTPAVSGSAISQGITGCSIVGNIVCSETRPVDVNWYLDNINVTSYGVSAIAATGDVSGAVSLNFNSCIVTQNTTANPAVNLVSCRATLTLVQVIQTTTASALSLTSGNSSVACNGTTLTHAGSATASPVVYIGNTIIPGNANTFYNTTFQYLVNTAGAGKTGIQFANAVNLPQTTLNQCVWLVGGSTTIITRTGIGSINVLWGQNVCQPISAVPASGSGLTYVYMTQDFIRANLLRDSQNLNGSDKQVLTINGTNGAIQWMTPTINQLTGWGVTPAASAYQYSPVMYNNTTGAVSYNPVLNSFQVLAISAAAISITPLYRGRTYVLTSAAGGGTQAITATTFSSSDTSFYCRFRNGNGTNGGDITLTGVTGNTVIHNQTSTQNGQEIVVIWNGTAFIAY